MSLIYWWPLTSNTTDQISGAAFSGSASLQSGGKIGDKYARQNSSQLTANDLSRLANLTSFSITMWVRLSNTNNSSQWSDLFGLHLSNGSQSDSFRAEVNSAGGNNFNIYNNGVSGTSGGAASFSLTKNVWTHLIIIKNKGTITSYVNGTKSNSTNWTSLNNAYATGEFHIGNGGMYCDYNDVRIYNHCLSPREVKLLAQGLVAHYKLETYTPNLLTNAEKYTHSSPLIKTSASTDGYSTTDMYCQVTPGETYYFTCETDGQWYQHNTSGVDPSNKYVTVWFYLTKTYDPSNTGYDNPVCLTKSMGNGRWIYQIPNGYNGLRIRTNTYSNGTNAITVKFWNFHLSKGNAIVPYSSQVIDCSGYGNHGTYSAIFNPSFNSPRYKNCSIFENNKYINCGRGAMVTDEITVSCWAYMDNWSNFNSSSMRLASCTESGGWNFEPSGNYMNFALGTGTSSNAYKSAATTSTLSGSGWKHFCGTYDGYSTKIYLNGVLEKTNSAYTTKTPIFYNATNSIFIGAEATSSASTPGGSYFNGKLSDFRIYATALPANAVKELYQSSISFLDNGTLQCSEIVENNTNLKYNQNGIVQANELNEIGYIDKMQVKTLSDGSAWARIHWLDVSSNTTYFQNEAEVLYCINQSNRFSLMQYIDYFKSKENKYEFMLTYPRISSTLYNRWTQTSSPNKTGSVQGLSFIGTQPWTSYNGGIRKLGSTDCAYHCSGDSGWYAPIGQYQRWVLNSTSQIPAADGNSTTETELWVRIDNLPKLTKLSMFDKAIQTSQIYEL